MRGKEKLAKAMKKHVNFLHFLHEAREKGKARRRIEAATPGELKTLVKVLHYISTGDIPLKSDIYKKLCKSKRFQKLQDLAHMHKKY